MKKLTFLLISACLMVLASCEKQINISGQDVEKQSSPGAGTELKSGHLVQNFRAHLSGSNEVPANPSQATGEALFQLSKDSLSLSYKLIVANIDNVRMSHIHLAKEGVNGAIVTWLYPAAPPLLLIPGTSNGILAEGVITQANLINGMAGKKVIDLVEQFKAGNAYVNVHTSQYGPGEIRGQIKGGAK